MTNLTGSNLNWREATGPKGEGRDSPSTFPKYPEYKDSGVEWLGEVPAHWDIKQLKYLVTCLDGQRIPLNGVERHSRQGSVPYWGANKIMDYVDEALFDEELVLLGEDGAPFFDVGRPVAFHSSGPVWPNNHIHVLRPGDAGWVKPIVYGLNSANYIDFVEGSTRDKLTQSRMMSIPLAWPPSEERESITAFLDHETARIDALVKEQQRLIELLKEKRQAVISHAVTKGLDPDVLLKDSGVEWLGEVPEHWDVTPVRAFVEEQTAKNASGDEENYLSLMANVGVIPYAEKGDVGNKKPDDLSKCKKVDIGDLVINSMNYGIGSYGLSGLKGVCSPVYIVLRPMEEQVLPRYALRIFENKEFQKLAQSFGQGILAHRSAIGWDDLKNIKVPMPEMAEQAELSAFLDHETARIDSLMQEGESVIKLFQERRSALISAAVSGKIDVRGWQPPAGSSVPARDMQTEAV